MCPSFHSRKRSTSTWALHTSPCPPGALHWGAQVPTLQKIKLHITWNHSFELLGQYSFASFLKSEKNLFQDSCSKNVCAIQMAFVNLKCIFVFLLVDYLPFNSTKNTSWKYAAMALRYIVLWTTSFWVQVIFFFLVNIFEGVSLLLSVLTDLPP